MSKPAATDNETTVSVNTEDARVTNPSRVDTGYDLRFLWIYAGLAGSLLLRLSVLDFESGDYRGFLERWYDYFVPARAPGGVQG